VRVGDGANLGLGVSVHQRRLIGPGAMVGMGAVVTRDVPPWATAFGSPARVRTANVVGMRRSGLPEEAVEEIARLYAGFDAAAGDPRPGHPALAAAFTEWAGRTDAPGTA
jgi:UDP-N-acetylglucosamine acyltransferase